MRIPGYADASGWQVYGFLSVLMPFKWIESPRDATLTACQMVLQGSSKSHDASSLPVPEIYHFLPYAAICPVKIVKNKERVRERWEKKKEKRIVAKSLYFLTRKVMMEFLECSAGIFFQRLVIKCFRYLNFRYNFSVVQAVFSRQPLSH